MKDRPMLAVMFVMLLVIISIVLISGPPQTLVTASAKTSNNAQGHSQFYAQHNLVSDVPGLADHTDPNMVNAWGLDAGPTTPWWVADNGTGKATLFNVTTAAITIFTVPGAGGAQGNPTGLVFNGGTGFVVNNGVGAPSAARFIFASEDGTISAFKGAPIVTVVPNANAPAHGAIYKGLAIDSRTAGQFLYATDFHNARIDVFNSSFHAVTLAGSFTDPNIPAGFAPFGIQNINGTIYVTYALQDENQEDDVAGPGNGFVDAFDTAGNFIRRVASLGELNSPWGLALAPAGFGRFSGDLLVGNFGDGRIHVFDPMNLTEDGEFEPIGLMHSAAGRPIQIDGLWSLQFGKDSSANGTSTTLFFTAGPADEKHGLFGSIVNVEPPGRQVNHVERRPAGTTNGTINLKPAPALRGRAAVAPV
ncbi:MAG TPA: TIGR03118 family protein [Pyrinomonadaceae bacterium]|nr:TIGR03118 family protein [Pyrinomonadaceae bacterium]